MLKLLGCIIILGASSTAGFLYADTFKRRVTDLNELQRIIYLLQSEIQYINNPIPKALKEISNKTVQPFSLMFNDISKLLFNNEVESVYEAFKTVLDRSKSVLSINKDDINILLDLSKTLGESDVESQKKIFDFTLESIKKQIESADNLMQKNLKVYRYLGITLGGMVVIMLI